MWKWFYKFILQSHFTNWYLCTSCQTGSRWVQQNPIGVKSTLVQVMAWCMWSFDVFFDLCLNKQLSIQSWGWWFETPSHWLWRHCNDYKWFGNLVSVGTVNETETVAIWRHFCHWLPEPSKHACTHSFCNKTVPCFLSLYWLFLQFCEASWSFFSLLYVPKPLKCVKIK